MESDSVEILPIGIRISNAVWSESEYENFIHKYVLILAFECPDRIYNEFYIFIW